MEMVYSGYLFIFNINILFFKTSHSEFVCYIDLSSIFDHDYLKKCSSDQILTDSWFKKKKNKNPLKHTHNLQQTRNRNKFHLLDKEHLQKPVANMICSFMVRN